MSTSPIAMSLRPAKHSQKTSSVPFSGKWFLWSITAVSICLAISSIVEIAIKVTSRNTRPAYYDDTYIQYAEGLMRAPRLGYNFFEYGDRLLFASAAFCLVSSMVAVMAVYHTSRKGPWKAKFWIRFLFRAAIALGCIMAIAALISLFASHKASARFDPDSNDQKSTPRSGQCLGFSRCPWPIIDYVYPGTFDRESWLCQFSSYPNFTINPWGFYNMTPTGPEKDGHIPDLSAYKRRCILEKGARWSSIAPVAFTLVLCLLFYIDWKGDGALIRPSERKEQKSDSNMEYGMEYVDE